MSEVLPTYSVSALQDRMHGKSAFFEINRAHVPDHFSAFFFKDDDSAQAANSKRIRANFTRAGGDVPDFNSRSTSESMRFSQAQAKAIDVYAKSANPAQCLSHVHKNWTQRIAERFHVSTQNRMQGNTVIRASADALKHDDLPRHSYGIDTNGIRTGHLIIRANTDARTRDAAFRDLAPLYDRTNRHTALQNAENVRAIEASMIGQEAYYRGAAQVVRAARDNSYNRTGRTHGGVSQPASFIDAIGTFNAPDGMKSSFGPMAGAGNQPRDPFDASSTMPGNNPDGSTFFHESPGDGITKNRLTYEDFLHYHSMTMNQGTMMDHMEKHMDFVKALGEIRLVELPYTLFMVSQEWDPMMMDLDAEEVPYTEGVFRKRSETRTFTRFGKSIRFTIESLQTEQGRMRILYESLRIGAAAGQTECYLAVLALITAAKQQESADANRDIEQARLPVDQVIAIMTGNVGHWARLNRRRTSAASTLMKESLERINRRGVDTAGRTNMLIVGRNNAHLVGASNKTSGVRLQCPVFYPDRMTNIDVFHSTNQIGEYRPIPWDMTSSVYGGACTVRSFAHYNYDALHITIRHHSGESSKISLGMVMRHYARFKSPNFWYRLFGQDNQGGDAGVDQHITYDAIIDAANDLWTKQNEGEPEPRPGQAAAERLKQLYKLYLNEDMRQENPVVQQVVHAGARLTLDAFSRAIRDMRIYDAVTGITPNYLNFIKGGIPLFANGIHAAPHVLYTLGNMLVFAKGSGTYVHIKTPMLMQSQATAELRNGAMSARTDTMALLTDARTCRHTSGTNIMGYEMGDDKGAIVSVNPLEAMDGDETMSLDEKNYVESISELVGQETSRNAAQVREFKAAFLLLDRVGNRVWQKGVMDLTGKLSSAHGALERESHYDMASFYADRYKWHAGYRPTCIGRNPSCTTPDSGVNTLCYLRDAHYSVVSADTGEAMPDRLRFEDGQGPRAHIIYDQAFKQVGISKDYFDDNSAEATIQRMSGTPLQMPMRMAAVAHGPI